MSAPVRRRAEATLIGPWTAAALVVGNMIGSGVFMLPASLAPFGWTAVIGWLFTIAGSLVLALTLARLARALPGDGPHGFVDRAFGTLPAFLIAWSYWLSIWVTNATIAVAAAGYAAVFWPALATQPALSAAATITVLWAFTLIACAGPRGSGRVQVVTTLVKIVPLVAVIALAGWLVAGGHATLPRFRARDVTLGAVTATAALALWAMLGFESACVPAGRVADPARTIPRATLWGTGVTGLIYLCVCSAVTLLSPPGSLAQSSAPFADFIARFVGAPAALAVAALAIVAALGALNGWVFLQGEMPMALARCGVFPRWFAHTNAAGAPTRALIVSSALASGLIAANATHGLTALFGFMALLATVNTLFLYLACALAAWRLRIVPAALAVPGAGYALWTFWGAGAQACLWGIVGTIAGLPIWWALRGSSNRRTTAASDPSG